MKLLHKLLGWVDARFPLTATWKAHVSEYYAPKNFNVWYFFGSLALLVLVIQIVSGIFLTMNYKPDALFAFASVTHQPADSKNSHRSIKPEYFVVLGICTHLGCSPTYRPEVAPVDLGSDWRGGWFCPCHGTRFDLAARVYKGSPAPTNMIIPSHKYLSDGRLLVGDDSKGAA